MTRLQETIVKIALSQVGVREQGGNNKGEAIRKYLESTWMSKEDVEKGFAWCSAFVTWVCKEARNELDLTYKELNLYIGAKAWDWEDWGKEQGWLVLPETEHAEPGDIVTFDFSHVGIIIEDNGDTISTVEGNTNTKGERDSLLGDGVWEKVRERHLIQRLVRMPNV
jgi:cell wall-associated NlpC family hydrolase